MIVFLIGVPDLFQPLLHGAVRLKADGFRDLFHRAAFCPKLQDLLICRREGCLEPLTIQALNDDIFCTAI